MTNDNGSYWQGYLGYPAVAFLINVGKIHCNLDRAAKLKNLPWKKLNTEFKNNFSKTLAWIRDNVMDQVEWGLLEEEVGMVKEQMTRGAYQKLGKRLKPPKGY